MKPTMDCASPEEQLEGFLAKYTPEIGDFARAALAKLRARLPHSIEIVYDNYNALAIGFSPTERTSDAVFSLVMYPGWVSFFFLQGTGLEDPNGLLRGEGAKVRHIRLKSPEDLDDSRVEALICRALAIARVPFDEGSARRLIIKSISEKQRPRRPGK